MQVPADYVRPTRLMASKGLELLTAPTPNGQKLSILLEELKAAYGLDYTVQSLFLPHNVQKEPWYTALDPNGKIPVLVDHDNGDFAVAESLAAILYLVHVYDKEHKFHFSDVKDQITAESWLGFSASELGPSMGQAGHYYRSNPNRYPFPTQRAIGEVDRVLGVLDSARDGRDYLAGPDRGKYSIADICNFGFINHVGFCGLDPALAQWPKLEAWRSRISQREQVKAGSAVPVPTGMDNESILRLVEEDPEFYAKEESLRKALKNVQAEFGYKYKSP